MPTVAREIRLAARPEGLPGLEHFEVVETLLGDPDEGEVLIRNRFCHVFASVRMMIGGGAETVDGVPFPAIRPGDALSGGAVGDVVAVGPGVHDLHPGDLVFHWRGWREYAMVSAPGCTPLPNNRADPVTHLEQGWTAYAALTRGVEVRPGDTVFVSGAGSSIGSMAGQIARLLGAGRVVGSAGSREKADRLVAELGYDAAVVRGAGPIADQLKKAAPGGIDVYFDNVGGEQLQAAVSLARTGARFVLIGALSGQLAERGNGMTAPVELDSFQILVKKIQMRGFSSDDLDDAARAEWNDCFDAWLRAGEITFPHVRIPGIARAPQALLDVIKGRHLGTVVVEL
jgi:NADPH-dependent curcumin reductase CurA